MNRAASQFHIVLQLTWRDVTQKYRKSKLGLVWSIMEPLAFLSVLYVVFGIGLRGGRQMEMPFILYLVTGLAVITFFNQTMNDGAKAVTKHSYLLRKMGFNMEVLPLVTVLSGLVNHFFFMIPAIGLILVHGIFPSVAWLQMFYYSFALVCLLLGVTLFTSAVGVFIPDLNHVVSVLGRVLFYFSPIIWDYSLIPESLQQWVKLNPLFYPVMGYRDAFFYSVAFWEKPVQTVYFWSWILGMYLIGRFVFRKLRPQFADVI